MESRERTGVVTGGQFYAHTPHFLANREARHPEATDERIIYVLEAPRHREPEEGNRHVCWRPIQELGRAAWWMKVVVADNASGPAILSAYDDTIRGVIKWGSPEI